MQRCAPLDGNCYITALQQCKWTFKFYYIYLIGINVSNVITGAIFELIIYTAFNLSWRKNTSDYTLKVYNGIQSDYSYRIISVYKREIVNCRHQSCSCYKYRSR
jgi:hypothetical protein